MSETNDDSSMVQNSREDKNRVSHGTRFSTGTSVENLLEIRHIENEDLKDSYDQLYIDCPIRHSDSFYRWILKILKPQKGKFLLDIACGQGRIIELAAANEVHAYGCDISFWAVNKNLAANQGLFVCNGEELSFPVSCFDYITNIGSLEHFVDPIKGIQEMSRVLKTDGRACILLPNTFGIFWNVLNAYHTGRLADDGQPIQRYGTRYKWQDLLESNGLKVVKTYKYECEWPLTIEDWGEYIRKPKTLIRLFLTPILPLNLANHFLFICSRK
jgi:SAM-dependent methyltransferase